MMDIATVMVHTILRVVLVFIRVRFILVFVRFIVVLGVFCYYNLFIEFMSFDLLLGLLLGYLLLSQVFYTR